MRVLVGLAVAAVVAIGVMWPTSARVAVAAPPDENETPQAEVTFEQFRLLVTASCLECHSADNAKGGLDLTIVNDESALRDNHTILEDVAFVLEEGDMPPRSAQRQLEDDERDALVRWIDATLTDLQDLRPNDPGRVIMPRVNHREYRYIVRDLTGYDLGVDSVLTPDTAAGMGFLNVGQAQTMTPAQFEGFLDAAKRLLGHAIILPETGITWYPAPQVDGSTPDDLRTHLRQKYADWFDAEKTDQIAEQSRRLRRELGMVAGAYFEAAWRFEHRAILGMPEATYADIAAGYDVPLYADSVGRMHLMLKADPNYPGDGRWIGDRRIRQTAQSNTILRELSARWNDLPAPRSPDDKTLARDAIKSLDAWIGGTTEGRWDFKTTAIELSPWDRGGQAVERVEWGKTEDGTQPFVVDLTEDDDGVIYLVVGDGLDDNREQDRVAWVNGTVDERPWQQVFDAPRVVHGEADIDWPDGRAIVQAPSVLELRVPEGVDRLALTLALDSMQASVQGMVSPEMPAVDADDSLGWLANRRGLGSKASDPARQLYEQAKSAGVLATTSGGWTRYRNNTVFAELSDELRRAYDVPDQQPMEGHLVFRIAPADLVAFADDEDRQALDFIVRQMRDAFLTDRPAQDAAARREIEQFATRVWRRDVDPNDLDALVGFYESARDDGASYDAAVKMALEATMVSPYFLYRITESRGSAEAYELEPHELATRLSFMLWGSLPDEPLLALAEAGELGSVDALHRQLHRMLADPRGEAFASEFAGQWLQFNDFLEAAAPDPEKFPAFSDELKRAMYDETRLFFVDLFRNNRPLTSVIDADYTFLNEALARHYGIDGVRGGHMRRVQLDPDDPAQRRRGGVLGMANFQVKYASPLRTSPVMRGTWVYEFLLGHHMPTPPADVGRISDDERSDEGLTIQQQLEVHRSNPSCISCHAKIDPLGIALENYDATGKWRDVDDAGEPVDSDGRFFTGNRSIDGVEGLRKHVMGEREQVMRHFCDMLVGYALGRVVKPSDKPLIDEMYLALIANETRPLAALEILVASEQFRMRRDVSDE
jgi:mono/diheme cytochrome c family protein